MTTTARQCTRSGASTLVDLIETVRPAHEVALLDAHESWTSAELVATVRSARVELCSRGIGAGAEERAVLIVPGSATATMVALLALDGLAPACPISPALGATELRRLVAMLEPHAVLVPEDFAATAREAAHQATIPVLDYELDGTGTLQLRGWLPRQSTDGSASAALSSFGACLLLATSGSSGVPKVVVHSRAGMVAAAEATIEAYRLDSQDCRLNFMPLHHVQGVVGGMLPPLLGGGRLAVMDAFQPARVASALARSGATWFSASPMMHQAIMDHEFVPCPSLRFVRVGSDALDADLWARLREAYRVPVVASYGMTEGTQIASSPVSASERQLAMRPTGSEVRVMGDEGVPVVGRVGRLQARGPNLALGYLRGGSLVPLPGPDAWFETGDIGLLHANGDIQVIGRLGGLISRGGEKFHVVEVEAELLAHPDVAEALVEPAGQGRVTARVTVVGAGPVADLRAWLRTRLAPYKVPDSIELVDHIPDVEGRKKQRRAVVASNIDTTSEATEHMRDG
jgi:oxalate---CoA ligase